MSRLRTDLGGRRPHSRGPGNDLVVVATTPAYDGAGVSYDTVTGYVVVKPAD